MESPYCMIKIEDEWPTELNNFDLLIVAGACDYRGYEILKRIKKEKLAITKILLFNFKERREIADKDLAEEYNSYRDIGILIELVDCSIIDPSLCIKSIKLDGLISKGKKVAIDISCFTKPYFFAILKYLKNYTDLENIHVFYSEPLSYIFENGLYKSYHSTNGTLRIMEIPGFQGIEKRSSKKVLIILLGFDGELSAYLSEEIAAEEIIIVNGFPSYLPSFKDISIINNDKLVESHISNMKYVKANHPFETYNLLEKIYMDRRDMNLNIAALGTKPMALGACLFAIMYPDVRVIYPLPEQYSNKTTYDYCNSWQYTIPLREAKNDC